MTLRPLPVGGATGVVRGRLPGGGAIQAHIDTSTNIVTAESSDLPTFSVSVDASEEIRDGITS